MPAHSTPPPQEQGQRATPRPVPARRQLSPCKGRTEHFSAPGRHPAHQKRSRSRRTTPVRASQMTSQRREPQNEGAIVAAERTGSEPCRIRIRRNRRCGGRWIRGIAHVLHGADDEVAPLHERGHDDRTVTIAHVLEETARLATRQAPGDQRARVVDQNGDGARSR